MDPVEKQRNVELAAKLLSEQNFLAAFIAGAVAMTLSAAAYGIVKSLSEGFYLFYSIAAAGIGVVIGFTMQFLGRGINKRFAVVAAVYALLGCMLGNLFAVVMDIARATGVSPLDLLLATETSTLYDWMFRNLHAADLMFWFMGVGAAAYFSRRALSREQMLALYAYRMKQ